jgi:hypothetical protein
VSDADTPARVPLRTTVLQTADSIVNGDRKATYGDAQESFERIATIWSAIIGHTIDAHDVALMMIGMKVSRSVLSAHLDNYVDIAGYAGLAAELAGIEPEEV